MNKILNLNEILYLFIYLFFPVYLIKIIFKHFFIFWSLNYIYLNYTKSIYEQLTL